MMKHIKRLSALLIALAIFFTGIPASAFYEDEKAVTLTEEQETDYSSAENDVVSFELLILPLYESGTTYSFTYDGFARNIATKVGNRTLFLQQKTLVFLENESFLFWILFIS